jgi:hypothetical protein
VRLRFTGRQENLIVAGGRVRIKQRFTGKEERCANLAGFEDVADPVLNPASCHPR